MIHEYLILIQNAQPNVVVTLYFMFKNEIYYMYNLILFIAYIHHHLNSHQVDPNMFNLRVVINYHI
jgi:hypothetical protein